MSHICPTMIIWRHTAFREWRPGSYDTLLTICEETLTEWRTQWKGAVVFVVFNPTEKLQRRHRWLVPDADMLGPVVVQGHPEAYGKSWKINITQIFPIRLGWTKNIYKTPHLLAKCRMKCWKCCVLSCSGKGQRFGCVCSGCDDWCGLIRTLCIRQSNHCGW